MEADLRAISEELNKGEIGYWEFWVINTLPIHGDYVGKGRPFGFSMQAPEQTLEVDPDDLASIHNHFGFQPEYCVQVDASCNDETDHAILGALMLHFATSLDGVIDFGGAILPRLPAGLDKKGSWWKKKDEWANVESYFRKMVEIMPGKVVSIEYQTINDKTWAYHVADATFLRAWLQHPDFHMIK